MNDFYIWFSTGLTHIADWQAFDHILFLFALCGIYTVHQWKSTLVLITAFTIGHSVTLALSVFNIIRINSSLVEFLIPVTILFTCVFNLYYSKKTGQKKLIPMAIGINYFMALFFGFVHGLGFSLLLKSLLGRNENIVFPLLSFNIGLEVGQLIVIFIIMLFSVALTFVFKITPRKWNLSVSSIILIIAFIISIQRFSELIKI